MMDDIEALTSEFSQDVSYFAVLLVTLNFVYARQKIITTMAITVHLCVMLHSCSLTCVMLGVCWTQYGGCLVSAAILSDSSLLL